LLSPKGPPSCWRAKPIIKAIQLQAVNRAKHLFFTSVACKFQIVLARRARIIILNYYGTTSIGDYKLLYSGVSRGIAHNGTVLFAEPFIFVKARQSSTIIEHTVFMPELAVS
jgi:hypothetical protein